MDRNGTSLLQRVVSGTMLAGVLHGSRDIRVEEVPRPLPTSGMLLLRVRRAGVCGSDIHYYSHGYCGGFVPTRPFVLGHEFVATVEETGPDVDSFLAGDRVVVNPASSCGHCDACRSGRCNLCRCVVMLGSASTTPPTDGAFAEFIVAPARQCYAVPETMSDSDAAMMEPLSVVLHAIARAGGIAGARVLVCGGGPIGLLAARASRAFGAAIVAVSEPNQERRKLAERLAIEIALDPSAPSFTDEVLAASDGGFDVVLEASGAPPAISGAFNTVRRGGVIVQIGTVAGNQVSVPVNDLMVREISLVGTFRYADEFPQAIRLVANGRIDFDGLVTATLPFDQVPQALEVAATNPSALKIHISNE